jgi:hypothetical protein
MDPLAKAEMKKQAGAPGFEDARCVDMFVGTPDWQARFCDALGESTQADKAAQASVEAARDTRRTYIISLAAFAISVVALIVGICK